MKANELRIGNYLNGKQGYVTVTEIRANNSVKIQDNTSSFYVGTCLEPIPITKEWLLKLGLNQNENFNFLHNGFAAGQILDDFVYQMWTIRIFKKIYIKVKYVHQLQNLYFALTGEELTIKQ